MADKEAMAESKADTGDASGSSVFADNECAQALLDLAKSYSPPNGVTRSHPEDLFSPDSLFSISSALYMNGLSNDRLKKRRDGKSGPGKTSILKRQLEHPDRRRYHQVVLDNYDPNIAVKIECRNKEDLRVELVKRIKLDHSYPCAGDFSWNRYVKALSHPSGDAPNKPPGKSNDGKPRKDHGPSSSQTSGSNASKNKKSSPDQKNGSAKSPNKATPLGAKGNVYNNNNCVNSYDVKKNCFATPQPGNHQIPKFDVLKPEKDNANQLASTPELYQPNDNKYKNLNLLLKCLTTDENLEAKTSPRESTDSIQTLSTSHDVSVGSEDGSQSITNMTECSEYQCMCCSRVFQQKRYMTKHMRRMHPEVMGRERRKEDTAVCPSCGLLVLRIKFKMHSSTCNEHIRKSKKQQEMDLANCQFCGIRMRRHILVRHLAQEHCVENARDGLFFLDDSDSSTLSGSEHDIEEEADINGSEENADNVGQDFFNSWQSDQLSNKATSEAASRDASESTVGFQRPASLQSQEPSLKTTAVQKLKDAKPLNIACQICRKSVGEKEIVEHVKEVHNLEYPCAKNSRSLSDSALKPLQTMCSHSMLHRFLSENSENASPLDAKGMTNEECRLCVQRLVSQSHEDDGYVSCTNNYASRPSPTNVAVSVNQPTQHASTTNATYTVFIPKENLAMDSVPSVANNRLGSDVKLATRATSHGLCNAESFG